MEPIQHPASTASVGIRGWYYTESTAPCGSVNHQPGYYFTEPYLAGDSQ